MSSLKESTVLLVPVLTTSTKLLECVHKDLVDRKFTRFEGLEVEVDLLTVKIYGHTPSVSRVTTTTFKLGFNA
uniref:Uncharacterized protein n=1 Tax=Arion vulgaris TaxID=1028688 RepID=A0A0B6ZT18_9EUPU